MCKVRDALCLMLAVLPMIAIAQSSGEVRVIDGERLRDPMQPITAYRSQNAVQEMPSRLPNSSEFTVSFIRAGGSSPVAVINNRSMTVGDELSGMRIMEIRAGAVVLGAAGQEYVLTTFGNAVRTPVNENHGNND